MLFEILSDRTTGNPTLDNISDSVLRLSLIQLVDDAWLRGVSHDTDAGKVTTDVNDADIVSHIFEQLSKASSVDARRLVQDQNQVGSRIAICSR